MSRMMVLCAALVLCFALKVKAADDKIDVDYMINNNTFVQNKTTRLSLICRNQKYDIDRNKFAPFAKNIIIDVLKEHKVEVISYRGIDDNNPKNWNERSDFVILADYLREDASLGSKKAQRVILELSMRDTREQKFIHRKDQTAVHTSNSALIEDYKDRFENLVVNMLADMENRSIRWVEL